MKNYRVNLLLLLLPRDLDSNLLIFFSDPGKFLPGFFVRYDFHRVLKC